MAEISVGLRIQFHFSRLYVLGILFGLTLSSQLEITEISELVEDFEDRTGGYLLEKHEIVRRAAGSLQPNVSMVRPSAFPSRLTSKTFDVTPSIYSSLKQSVSPIARSHIGPINPSTTATLVIRTVSASFPPTKAVTAPKKPDTPTTKKKSTDKRTTPTRRTTTAFPSKTDYDEDHHKYYKSQYYSNGTQWWFNLDDGSKKTVFHRELSKNIKFSDLFKTSFIFPYYGHLVENVTITNKGYLFLGERLHKFNASAQYVAPLMADFGADLHDNTAIRYIDTGDRLTVEWTKMKVRKEAEDKEFSFQCSIFKNGTLIFAYSKIPIPVEKIRKADFFVRVGLSDTYRTEKVVRGLRKIDGKWYSAVRYITYHLYDRVRLPKTKVVNGSAFVLIPLPNCVMFNSCDTCLNTPTKFHCIWCPKIKRCSDGIDRHRMEWETAGCMKHGVKSCSGDSSAINGGEIAVIVLVVLVVIFVVAWCVYAYTHPQSKSGLFLIKYGNPTKWFRNSIGTQSSSTDGRISFKTMPFESNA